MDLADNYSTCITSLLFIIAFALILFILRVDEEEYYEEILYNVYIYIYIYIYIYSTVYILTGIDFGLAPCGRVSPGYC